MINALNARPQDLNAAFTIEVRFTPTDPFAIDTEKASRSTEPGNYPLDFRNTTAVNLQYRVIGNTGLVWGYHRDAIKPKDGQLQSYLHRALLVYVKVDGRWLRAATHQSAVPNGNWCRPSRRRAEPIGGLICGGRIA
jgi:hypothetical protein